MLRLYHHSYRFTVKAKSDAVTTANKKSLSPQFIAITTTTISPMDVIFEPQRGKPFSIEVGFFDSVLEIKEKIQKYQGIPVQEQTLVFQGQVLQDDCEVHHSDIVQNSNIQLLIASDTDNKLSHIKIEETSPSKKIQLNIKFNPAAASSKTQHVPVEMDANDTVLHLKEKINEMEHVPVSRLVLQSSGGELQDHRSLRDSELNDNSEVVVNVKPSPTGSGAGSPGAAPAGPKKMRVMVLTKCGTKKIPVEVSPSDKVLELKNELQRLQQKLHFHLPTEGYFFIYKQNVMDDNRSLRSHNVCQGDTIEIFNGSVTGGS